MKGFNYKKAVQALNFFAFISGGTLNKMKAIKLIWLSDRYHLRHYGRTITGDVYFALPYGPVPSTTRDILENNIGLSDDEQNYSKEYIKIIDKFQFESIKDYNPNIFSKTDLDSLNKILEKYNPFDHFQLSELSHSFPEWKKYEPAFKTGVTSRFEMSLDDFFINHDDGSGLFIDSDDFLRIAQDIYSH